MKQNKTIKYNQELEYKNNKDLWYTKGRKWYNEKPATVLNYKHPVSKYSF